MSVVAFPSPTNETADQRAARLWGLYVMAAQTAQTSLRLEDGIAAGKAWGEFVRAFEQC